MEACRDRPGAAGPILHALNNLLHDRFAGERAAPLTSGHQPGESPHFVRAVSLGSKDPNLYSTEVTCCLSCGLNSLHKRLLGRRDGPGWGRRRLSWLCPLTPSEDLRRLLNRGSGTMLPLNHRVPKYVKLWTLWTGRESAHAEKRQKGDLREVP